MPELELTAARQRTVLEETAIARAWRNMLWAIGRRSSTIELLTQDDELQRGRSITGTAALSCRA